MHTKAQEPPAIPLPSRAAPSLSAPSTVPTAWPAAHQAADAKTDTLRANQKNSDEEDVF